MWSKGPHAEKIHFRGLPSFAVSGKVSSGNLMQLQERGL
jgi:hypothetical protein